LEKITKTLSSHLQEKQTFFTEWFGLEGIFKDHLVQHQNLNYIY